MPAHDCVYDHETGRWAALVSRSRGHASLTAEYNANQVNNAILTPPADRRVCVSGVMTAADGNIGQVSIDFLVSGTIVWRHYVSRFGSMAQNEFHVYGNLGEALTLNTTTGANLLFMIVNYRIVD